MGLDTRLDRKEIVVSKSCLVRVDMSFATVEWKIIFRDSSSRSESTLISNRSVGAGVLGGTFDLMLNPCW